MFINLATENIMLYDNSGTSILPFHDVEVALSDACISSYRSYLPDVIYVLNGPGSFTNLRVGALIVNTLLLLSHSVVLKSVDKLALYGCVVSQWLLPRYGYIFMWQRKNVWYYDFENSTYLVLSKSEIAAHIQHNTQDGQDSFFVDLFVGADFADFFQWHPLMVNFLFCEGEVLVSFCGKECGVSDFFLSNKKMDPYYAMEPNIW